MSIDLTEAANRATDIRKLYEILEKYHHGAAWSSQEIMLGFMSDVGELSKLVMAAENRWMHEGNVPEELTGKLSECLWWLMVLAQRFNVDLSTAYPVKMDELEGQLAQSAGKAEISSRGL